MKITKIGHCCLVIEIGELKILTDPGAWTTEQNTILDVNVVVITHEHGDHFHLGSVQAILTNNPAAQIITNQAVGQLLDKAAIPYTVVEDEQSLTVAGVTIRGLGTTHADIYKEITPVTNTGYFINDEFFYPGDALTVPTEPVKILALPVAGPWVKVSEVLEYGLAVKPQVYLPMHDGMLKITDFYYRLVKQFLEKDGRTFVPLSTGEMYES